MSKNHEKSILFCWLTSCDNCVYSKVFIRKVFFNIDPRCKITRVVLIERNPTHIYNEELNVEKTLMYENKITVNGTIDPVPTPGVPKVKKIRNFSRIIIFHSRSFVTSFNEIFEYHVTSTILPTIGKDGICFRIV